MSEKSENSESEKILIGDVHIEHSPRAVTMADGAVLRGWESVVFQAGTGRKRTDHRSDTPLICLPSDLGTVREYEEFAVQLQAKQDSPRRIFSFDLRGRGASDWSGEATYSPLTDADDLVTLCDALSLHHADFLVTGRSAIVALLTAPKRPGMINRLIFNDCGPEKDGVGIVRVDALNKMARQPKSWSDAVEELKSRTDNRYPALSEDDWAKWARILWADKDGAPFADHDKKLKRVVEAVDFDTRQPTLWKEMAILANRSMLLLRAENSLLMTEEIAKQMAEKVGGLQEVVIEGQGHPILLPTVAAIDAIHQFLPHSYEDS